MPVPPSASGEPARIDALDGLRGLAILAVVLFHALLFAPFLPGASGLDVHGLYPRLAGLGWCGVDVFFVLSGFLITGILLRSKGSPHYFRNFYARRALRIFPLYYVVIVLLLFVLERPPATAGEKVSYLLYYQNVRYAIWGEQHEDLARLVTWSLAIEEQFYLVWPAVVWCASRRALAWICVAAIVGAAGLRFVLLGAGLETTHFLTPCRVDTLAAGALIALRGAPPRWLGHVALVGGAGWLYWLGRHELVPLPEAPDMQRYGLLAALALAVGLLTVVRAGGWLAAACSWWPLRSLGQFSYCVYLVHQLVIDRLTQASLDLSPATRDWLVGALPPLGIVLVFTAACLLVSWGIGAASWHLFEKWFLGLKRHFPNAEAPGGGVDAPGPAGGGPTRVHG